MPGLEHRSTEGVRVDGVGGRRGSHRGQGGEPQSGLLPLGHQRGVDGLGVGFVEQPVDHVMHRSADLPVQLRHQGGEPVPLCLGLVDRVGGELGDGLADQGLDVRGGQDLLLDRVEHDAVQDLDADGDPRAGRGIVLAGGAVVQEGPLLRCPASRDADPTATGPAAQPGSQEAALAQGHRVGPVALALLPVAIPQRPLRLDPGEGLFVDRGLVGVARHDLAVVGEVPDVGEILEDAGDMLGPPGPRGDALGQVGPGRRRHGLSRETRGDARRPIAVLVGHAEDPLRHLELRARPLGDGQAAILDLVAIGGQSVDPAALLGLRAHAPLHVGGQFLRVALGQPRQDRPDELAERTVGRVLLRQRDDLDVGVVQGAEGAQAIKHVAGDAGEGPDVQAGDRGRTARSPGLPVGDLGLRPAQQALVAVAVPGRAPADALVDEPVLGWDDHPVGGRASLDLGALLVDGLVLARVAAAQVGGADDGHGRLRVGSP